MSTNETIGCPGKAVAMIAVTAFWIAMATPVQAEPGQNESESANANETMATPDTIPTDEKREHNGNCEFWGNSFSLKFHIKNCPFAQAMNPQHVQFLNSIEEALTLGEKPCRYCLPPYELSVSCKILGRTSDDNQSDKSADKQSVKTVN